MVNGVWVVKNSQVRTDVHPGQGLRRLR
jgi:hypothetical protein